MSLTPAQQESRRWTLLIPRSIGGFVSYLLFGSVVWASAEYVIRNPSAEQRACTFGRYWDYTKDAKPQRVQVFV